MIHPIFFAKISKQNIVYHHPDQLRDYLLTFKDGQELEVVVKKFRKNRTLNQNSWYHGIILPLISDHTGFTEDECCEVLRKKFLSYQKAHNNKLYRFTRSTADLSTAEFTQYIDAVIRFASMELGIVIPDPKNVSVDNSFA